ncbi:ExbD/TolR family protein [Nitrospina watsonii]|uniref:Biopolymer transport protein ExbD/TolR n=1 Tax=Nitrospina watsonii TaxID=1323948 RepID=A0ABN8VYW4_9BACT|nr:biopolymer transporter ExbD [Nitrospina watsonii]CAI2718954.1 Biopolymer transport protein ExbD/TolR [Nitrospina watsonii]
MYFKREEEENYSLELTPLVDVVFLLLIFFMVSTAFVDFPRQLQIDLPTSKTSNELKEREHLEIEMTGKEKIFLNGKPITVKELEAKVEAIESPALQQALIRADKALPYGQVVEVMGILQAAKIADISIAVK